MTQGKIETTNYYTIKIGDTFLKEFEIGSPYDYENGQPYIKEMSFTKHVSQARKWYFDGSLKVGTEDDAHQARDFGKALKILQDSGMIYEIFKTTTVTTEEQKEVSFVEGEEKEVKNNKWHISNEDNSSQSYELIGEWNPEKIESGLYDTIYAVCEQAVKDLNAKETENFLDNVTKALKK